MKGKDKRGGKEEKRDVKRKEEREEMQGKRKSCESRLREEWRVPAAEGRGNNTHARQDHHVTKELLRRENHAERGQGEETWGRWVGRRATWLGGKTNMYQGGMLMLEYTKGGKRIWRGRGIVGISTGHFGESGDAGVRCRDPNGRRF